MNVKSPETSVPGLRLLTKVARPNSRLRLRRLAHGDQTCQQPGDCDKHRILFENKEGEKNDRRNTWAYFEDHFFKPDAVNRRKAEVCQQSEPGDFRPRALFIGTPYYRKLINIPICPSLCRRPSPLTCRARRPFPARALRPSHSVCPRDFPRPWGRRRHQDTSLFSAHGTRASRA